MNEDRAERGAFDKPPFIGPFVEMVYTIEVKSLMPADQEKPPEEKTAPTTPATPERAKPGTAKPAGAGK